MDETYPGTVGVVSDTRSVTSQQQTSYSFVKTTLPSSGARAWAIIDNDGVFHEAGTNWLRWLAETRTPDNTIKSYGRKVAAYLTWLAGLGWSWRSADLTVVTSWKSAVATTPLSRGARKGQPPKAATVSAYVAALLSFYRWASATGNIDPNAVAAFFQLQRVQANEGSERVTHRLVRVKELQVPVPETPPAWLETQAEVDIVFAVPMNLRDWTLVSLLFVSGIRIGECLSLFRADMHLTADSSEFGCRRRGPHIHIHDNNDVLIDVNTKDKRGRAVPVPSWWVTVYADYQHERATELGADENPHVFVNLYGQGRGNALHPDTVRDLFERISRVTGLHVTPHTMRHTRASWWLHGTDCDKVDVDTVQELMGHASIQSTQVYLHAPDASLRAAVDSVAPLLRDDAEEAS